MALQGITISVTQECFSGTGTFNVNVGTSYVQSIYVTFTGQNTGTVTSATISGVSSYTFIQAGLPNDTYTIVAHTSISGNSNALQRTLQCTQTPTGYKGYRTLEQYYIDNNQPTGARKTNDPSDPDYAPPVLDGTCDFNGSTEWQPIYYEYSSGANLRGCFTGMMRNVVEGIAEPDRVATELETSIYNTAYGYYGQACPIF